MHKREVSKQASKKINIKATPVKTKEVTPKRKKPKVEIVEDISDNSYSDSDSLNSDSEIQTKLKKPPQITIEQGSTRSIYKVSPNTQKREINALASELK